MRFQVLLATLGFLPILAACSSHEMSDSDTDEGATVVEPNGTDSPAKLLVTVPNGPVDPSKVTCAGKSDAPGQAIGPIAVGDQDFTLQSGSLTMRGRANFKAGQTTTVPASLLSVDAVSGPRTLGLAKDPAGGIMVLAIDAGLSRGSIGAVAPTANGTTGFAVLPGTFEVSFGVGGYDGVPVTFGNGDTKKVVLTDTSKRRVTRIQAPTRDMPSANCGARGIALDAYHVALISANYSADAAMPPGAQIEVGVAPSKPAGDAYEIQTSAWNRPTRLPLPAAGQGPLTWTLGRIDVDDVLINNAQPRVPGTYMIYRDANGVRGEQVLACSPKTKSGVDLPPGKYRVEVTYHTVEAGDKVDLHVVDVP